MISHCKNNLLQIKNLTIKIDKENYKKPCAVLFQSTIGQHIRHALEFYLCLLEGLDSHIVNYDERKRQYTIENCPNMAAEVIETIISKLNTINQNQFLEIKANYTSDYDVEICMKSSLYRELGVCLEHSIHHQAIVKSGLKELDCLNLVNHNFGVAPSTIRNQKKCAQ